MRSDWELVPRRISAATMSTRQSPDPRPRRTLARRSGILKFRDWQVCWRITVERVFDVIVVGLGAMGSAAVYHLSKQTKVLGLDAFIPAHDKGSSHGESRIIRQAYF